MSGGMTLQTLDFIRLLPQFVRDDLAVQGIAKALNDIIPGLSQSVGNLTTWDKIGELSESELDSLAWELNILWYDKSATIETKRELILNSDKVYRHLGTKWAVENVVTTYFGEGSVQEWFEYGGEPGHFRVMSTNPSLNSTRYGEFINVLNKVKRASSKFDGLNISLDGELILSAGAMLHDIGQEQYTVAVSGDYVADDLYAVGEGDAIVITTTKKHGSDGDAIILNTSMPVKTSGDAIIIG
jgi:phage tail P2-like protein